VSLHTREKEKKADFLPWTGKLSFKEHFGLSANKKQREELWQG
jgi:hypothetical protein